MAKAGLSRVRKRTLQKETDVGLIFAEVCVGGGVFVVCVSWLFGLTKILTKERKQNGVGEGRRAKNFYGRIQGNTR